MKKEIEYEARTMLNSDQYKKLMGVYFDSSCSFFKQENRYFDTDDTILLKNGIVVRIRVTDKSSLLQIKIKGKNGDEEYHFDNYKLKDNMLELPNEIKNIIFNKIQKEVSAHYIASLITERLEKRINNHLLVIDKNSYLDTIDYNLEIEADSKENANQIMDEYCTKYDIELTKNYVSKSRRAISLMMK